MQKPMVEHIWLEINARINYPALCEMLDNEDISLDDDLPLQESIVYLGLGLMPVLVFHICCILEQVSDTR